MKLSLTIVASRIKQDAYAHTSAAKREDYEKVNVTEIKAPAAVLAGLLRSIADDIDPAVRS